MAKVATWFPEFVEKLQNRIPRADWPQEPDYWLAMQNAFIRHGVTSDVAEVASIRLAEEPPPFPDRLISEMLKQIRAVWAIGEVGNPAAPESREVAERAAKDCVECAGMGFATRWRQSSAGRIGSDGRPKARSETFYCVCAMGRWMREKHARSEPPIRFPDLQTHTELWGDEYRMPPACMESLTNDPTGLVKRMMNVLETRKIAMRPQTTIAAATSESAF